MKKKIKCDGDCLFWIGLIISKNKYINNDISVHCAFFLHMGQLGVAIPKATSLPLIINQIKQKYNNDVTNQCLDNF